MFLEFVSNEETERVYREYRESQKTLERDVELILKEEEEEKRLEHEKFVSENKELIDSLRNFV